MEYKCPKCDTPIVEESLSWAPNDLDKRTWVQCSNCGWESDDEFDEYHMPDKEVLIMEADGSRYIHGERYEVTFYDEEGHYSSIIGTKYSWEGPVKVTIQSLATKASDKDDC